MSAKIIVLGAAVIDHVYKVDRLPNWGEGVHADSFIMLPGGKGLNQAVAAAKLGADVALVSTVGDDYYGRAIIDTLEQYNISHDFVWQIPETITSVVNVFVNPQSEAAFLGWKGSEHKDVFEDLLGQAEKLIRTADAILLTFELPFEVVEKAVRIAREGKGLVVLNPSPPIEMSRSRFFALLDDVHLLVPNLREAEFILQAKADPRSLAGELHEKGAKTVVLTSAERGCFIAAGGQTWVQPAYDVELVDSTGASDAFCAALAVALAEGQTLNAAVRWANAAGALAVGQAGASPSMPERKVLEDFLLERH